MKKNINFFGSVLVLSLIMSVVPITASAETLAYQPQTQAEKVAYIYGRIAQLLQIKQFIDKGKTWEEATALSQVDYVTMSTHKAIDSTATTAVLRGEVNIYGKATASAWFEYGTDKDFLDQRTNQVSIRSVYDRAVRVSVRSLKPDQRYYFRMATTDNNKIVTYGDVYSFSTDELVK
ncbi:hypothetical protein GW766_02710 [Candidatus Parcubacteria bacterium]|nr:hypothetical protein [Candidatus Parcubacteria bacterium]